MMFRKMQAHFIVAALSLTTMCSQALAGDQRDVVIAPDGTEITKVVQSNRRMPHSTIGVCSDGWFDDVENLKTVARIVLPEETYTIVDANSLPEDFDRNAVTLVYFGAPLSKIGSNECLDRFPKLKEFVVEAAHKIQADNDQHDKVLQKQFGVNRRILGDVNCAGKDYPEYHFRTKSKMKFIYRYLKYHSEGAMCEMGYTYVFDIYELYLNMYKDDFAVKIILNQYN